MIYKNIENIHDMSDPDILEMNYKEFLTTLAYHLYIV